MKIYITDKAFPKKPEIEALLERRALHEPDFSGIEFDVQFVHVPEGDPEIEIDTDLESYAMAGLYQALSGVLLESEMNELKTIPELIEEDFDARRKAWQALPIFEQICQEIEAEMEITGKHFNDC